MNYEYQPIGIGCEIFSGFAFKSADFSDEGIPIIKIGNLQNKQVNYDNVQYLPIQKINNKHKKFLLNDKDILIAMTGQGSVGRVGRIRKHEGELILLNQRVGKIVADEIRVNRDYLYFILSSDKYEKVLFDMAVGSGQPNLSPAIIKQLEISMPPYDIQVKIAKILNIIDEKIRINNKLNENLEYLGLQIFYKVFGKNLENTNATIGDLGKVVTGKTPATKDADNYGDDIPFIKTPDMHGNMFIADTEKGLSTKGANSQENKYLPPYTVIMACIGAGAGEMAITSDKCQTNQQINAVISQTPCFTYYILKTKIQILRNGGSAGSTMININKTTFENCSIYLPQKQTLNEFENTIFPIFETINNRMKENQSLLVIRDTLLPKLMSGKIDLENINIDN